MKKLLLSFAAFLALTSCEFPETQDSPGYETPTNKYFLGSFNFTTDKAVYLTGDVGQYEERYLWVYNSDAHTLTINNNSDSTKEVIDVIDMMDGKLLFTSQETEGIYSEMYDFTKIKNDTLSVETSYVENKGKVLYIK